MSPVARALEDAGADYVILHTGQHYSANMDRVFFEDLKLRPPDRNLNVGSGSHAEETGKMLMGVEKALLEEGAGGVLVEGDTNTVLAGALAAAKLRLRVGHVEAGLRSGDRGMPEELNRVVADHLCDVLFAPTPQARKNLEAEGIRTGIFVTGNTVVDAIRQNMELAREAEVGGALEGVGKEYILATVHRQENVDERSRLKGILGGLERAARKTGLKVVYPAHPRSVRAMEKSGLKADPGLVKIVEPVGYLAFLRLEQGARLILTDSGGVQEEACVLGVPCVTLRDNTERPETVLAGANVLAGADPGRIAKLAASMLAKRRGWRNPFGDGRAGPRIVKAWLGSEKS
jgi:UDP-N-acetylglucosamine 2-epimerase (non-hydrolysing)